MAEALQDHKDQILRPRQIIGLVLAKFPHTVKDSIQVKDHEKPWYPRAPVCSVCRNDESNRLLDQVGWEQYKVRNYY